MTNTQNSVPKWILLVSGIIALMEVMVSILLCYSPQEVVHSVDVNANGVMYIIQMWSARQFALGVIFAFATLKKSAPMLTLSYIFFLVMMLGDFYIGLSHKENELIISAIVMSIVSSAMIFAVNRRNS